MKRDIQLLDRYLELYLQAHNISGKKFNPELSRFLGKLKKQFLAYRITLVKKDGIVIADSDSANSEIFENHRYRKEIQQAKREVFGFSSRFSTTFRTEMLYLAYFNDNYYVRIARLLDDVDSDLAIVNRVLLIVVGLVLLLMFFLNIVVSNQITKPIREMAVVASTYHEQNFSGRMQVRRDDEIGFLQATMNEMAGNIELLLANIRNEKGRLEDVINTINEGLLLVGSDGKTVLFNDNFVKMFPGKPKYKGVPYYSLIGLNKLNSAVEEAFKKKDNVRLELDMIKIEERFVEVTILPVVKEAGVLVVLKDITDKKKYQKMKSDFVANASHELKTPISIVSGYIESLRDESGIDKAERQKFFDRIENNLSRLTNLVGDITTLNKLEDGDVSFQQEKTDLNKLIEQLLFSLSAKLEDRSVTVDFRQHRQIVLLANYNGLESVFYNLIDNAINYNKEESGFIQIDIEQENGCAVVSVFNEGEGLPKGKEKRIFERFYRVNKGRARNSGGTGLGLSIVKHAVLNHGGTVTASSDGLGKGVLFKVKLPI